jgi:hypothetical protein
VGGEGSHSKETLIMPREISDDEYTFLQGKRQIADFIETIYNDPALNREAKALIKKKYPQMQIPDYDIEERVEARFAAEKKQRDDAADAERQQREQQDWQDKRAATQKQYGFTEEAMADLEKMMVERNIGDYEVAAQFKASKDPRPSEADMGSFRWDHEKQPGFADIAKDPEGWARKELMTAMRVDADRERGRG